MKVLTERYSKQVAGVLGCFDRVVLQGMLMNISFSAGITSLLESRGLGPMDFPAFCKPMNDAIRANTERVATQAGCRIEFVRHNHCRKEDLVAKILARRGDHPGLVHVLSAMETCPTFRLRRDKEGRHILKWDVGKCMHYYFYFIDKELGLCYLRVPTWAPFRLQFYFNGHNQLARKLRQAKVEHEMLDNAFLRVADLGRAQRLANDINVKQLASKLNHYARLFCPPGAALGQFSWTIMQAEYSTDIIFHRQADLQPLYQSLTHTAIHAVQPDDVATFLGRKLTSKYQGVLGNDFSTRIEGTRIKHYMGKASIKMYDKAGIILRIETTANDVTLFRTRRWIEQRDGRRVFRVASLRKSIESLPDLRELMGAANRRYLEFLSALDDTSTGAKSLRKISSRVEKAGRGYRGINFFSAEDLAVFKVLSRGEFAISGIRNKDLRHHLSERKPAWVSRCIKRLRVHGLLKNVAGTYKYFLTALGKRVLAAALAIREMGVIPALATPPTPIRSL